jgi:hypothetical protein
MKDLTAKKNDLLSHLISKIIDTFGITNVEMKNLRLRRYD